MQLAKVQLARSIWLFDFGEMNPFGSSVYPALFEGLVDRYRFRKYPKPQEIQVGTSVRFDFGQFVKDSSSHEVSLEIFGDGITADSRHSTTITDLFIFDVISWTCETFNFQFTPVMSKKRAYRSELIFYADKSLSGTCERADEMASRVSEMTGHPSELTAITFGNESKNSLLTIERKANEPFEDLKFFSAAQMETQMHIKVLDGLGQFLLPGSKALLGS